MRFLFRLPGRKRWSGSRAAQREHEEAQGFFPSRKPQRECGADGQWVLHFDGACEPFNPGGTASYGWTLHAPDGHLTASDSGVVCRGPGATNNVAEWGGLLAGLTYLSEQALRVPGSPFLPGSPVLIRGDSQLVVNQLTGKWRCNKPHLARHRDRARELLRKLRCAWDAVWIPRERNAEADALSRSHCR